MTRQYCFSLVPGYYDDALKRHCDQILSKQEVIKNFACPNESQMKSFKMNISVKWKRTATVEIGRAFKAKRCSGLPKTSWRIWTYHFACPHGAMTFTGSLWPNRWPKSQSAKWKIRITSFLRSLLLYCRLSGLDTAHYQSQIPFLHFFVKQNFEEFDDYVRIQWKCMRLKPVRNFHNFISEFIIFCYLLYTIVEIKVFEMIKIILEMDSIV